MNVRQILYPHALRVGDIILYQRKSDVGNKDIPQTPILTAIVEFSNSASGYPIVILENINQTITAEPSRFNELLKDVLNSSKFILVIK